MLDSDMKRGFDYYIFGAVVLLGLIGVMMIYSGTHTLPNNVFWIKQLIWFGIGLIFMMSAVLFDYQLLGKYSKVFYIGTLVLLIMVLFCQEIRSAKSWFLLGPISFQPSEFAKLVTIIFLSEYLSTKKDGLDSLDEFIPPLIIIVLPILLILLQPDIGTVLVFLPIFFVMLYLIGIRSVYLIVLTSITCLTALMTLFLSWGKLKPINLPIIGFLYTSLNSVKSLLIFLVITFLIICTVYYILSVFKGKIDFTRFSLIFIIIAISSLTSFSLDHILKDYQRKRLLIFIDPNIAPLGAGYNIIQSKIAIGSGKFFGEGFLNGTQSQLGFLPERQADFIFSVIGEELGFVGAVVILLLFIVIIYRGIAIAFSSRDLFGSLLAAGIVTMLGFQVFFNVGVSIGIMPVTGITLPLISYGGSSLVITMIAIGILLNIRLKRYLV